jgi:chromosome segregation ATPase
MKDFTVGLQQSLAETHEAATQSMEEFTKASVDGLNSVVESANEAIRAEANDFANRAKRYDASFGKLLSKLESHSESLDAISTAHEKLREAAELTQSTVATANTHFSDLAQAAQQASAVIDNIAATCATVSQSAEQLQAAVDQLETGLRSVTSETEKQLTLLRLGPGQAVDAALSALAVASEALNTELAQLASKSEELNNQLNEQGRLAVESAKRNAEALDQELARSREATSRVHGSLVEMTDTLARQVEGRT